MAEPTLCLSWNDHANELARMWKTLLDNNSFVDCIIAAEGKSVKAHRLILSACSPYFQMLFNEENEKYPIVILRDTSFHMLQTLIDFVYNGKVEISTSQLETFLELAVSLQIKGLNNYLDKDRTINILGNVSGEIHQCSSRVNRDNSRVEKSRTSYEESLSKCSHQCHFHFSQDNSSSTQTVPPVQFEGSHDSAEGVQSRVAMVPVQNQPSHPVHCNSNVVVKTDQNLKEEHVFSEIKILETRSEVLDSVNHVESMSGNPESEMNNKSAPVFEENLEQYSNGRESLHSNGNSALVLQQRQQQLREEQLQQQQKLQQVDEQQKQHDVPHSASELSSPPELSKQYNQILPELLVPLSVKAEDSESEESTHALDVPGNDTEEMDEETELTCEESLDPSSGAEGSPPPQDEDQGQVMPVRLGGQRPANSAGTAPSAPELQAHVRLLGMPTLKCRDRDALFPSSRDLEDHKRQHSGTQPFRRGVCGASPTASSDLAPHQRQLAAERQYSCDVCGKAFAEAGALALHKHRHKGKRRHSCDVCGKAFKRSNHLTDHKRTHTGERPYSCDVCGKAFKQSIHLIEHQRTHPGERPFSCDVCGKAFKVSGNLVKHKRTHTGERPFSCDVCGKAFKQSYRLIVHKRTHTGELPFSCDVCGKSFKQLSHLTEHKRTHTGQRSFSCDVCRKSFKHSSTLIVHQRTHTGERPFSCDVCGKAFKRSTHLTDHKRTHTGERPFSCDVCGKAFSEAGTLAAHKLTHTGQRPIGCDVCSLHFSSKSAMISHWQRTHVTQ